MKIVPKLTLALVGGTCSVLAANAYLRVHREVEAFEVDRAADHETIARAIAAETSAVWRSEGRGPALASLAAAGERTSRIQVRWLSSSPGVDLSSLSGAAPVTRVERDASGDPHLDTLVAVDVDGVRRGAIELTEQASVANRFARGALVDAALAAAALAVLSAALSFVLGQWLIGRPVGAISDKARRIGRGDFGRPLAVRSDDELGALARDVDTMCEQLRATVAQLRHADRLSTVGTLASGVAHELGTPLNVVSVRADTIADGETTDEESRAYAKVISGAAERMTKIIQQLLQFARRAGAQKAPCRLDAIARDAADLLAPLAAKRGCRFDVRAPALDATVEADAAQLQQVLMNLMMNAIQAMPSGGDVTVEVDEARVAPPADLGAAPRSYARLAVRDRGAGISAGDLEHVFEPFFTTKDVGEGTGLGLAVAYGIVRDHGGFIAVESAVGGGTTFTVHLPKGDAP
jgi:signal transduction histidine kinase